MAQGKKTFIFYSDWINMVNEMPNEDAGELLKHILSYVNDQNPITENILVKMAFGHMKPILKADLEKWDKQLKKFSEMGRNSAKKRAISKVQPTLTKVKPMSTVNDNDNVNDNNIRESALDFLKSDLQKWQIFEMQNKSRFKDWEKMLELFSYKVDEENLKYDLKILNARLFRWMSSWESNNLNSKRKQEKSNFTINR